MQSGHIMVSISFVGCRSHTEGLKRNCVISFAAVGGRYDLPCLEDKRNEFFFISERTVFADSLCGIPFVARRQKHSKTPHVF